MRRALLSDPWIRLLGAALGAILVLYLAPVFNSSGWMEAKGLMLPPIMIAALMAAIMSGLSSLSNPEERRFWRLIALAHVSYLVGFTYLGEGVEVAHARVLSLFEDTTILGYYGLYFLALVAAPHLGQRSTAMARVARVRTIGSITFVFGMLVYFILIPAAAGRGSDEAFIPTLFLYAALDLIALVLLLGLVSASRSRRWRRIYGLFACNALVWFLLDLTDGLMFIEVIPYTDPGSLTELSWVLPYPFLALAARIKNLESDPAPTMQLAPRTSGRTLAPIVMFVAAAPLIHLALYETDFAVESIRPNREICVLVLVLVLGGLAWLEHRYHEAERLRIQAQMLQAQKMESLGTLAGGIAHSFNNLLTVILGRTQLALNDEPGKQLDRAGLEAVLAAGMRARELVQQILAFSRKRTPKVESLSIETEVRAALEIARASVPSGVELVVDVEPTPGEVLADPAQLQQVVINLCSNAFHAVPETNGRVEVSLRAVRLDAEAAGPFAAGQSESQAHLRVRDNGAGMNPEVVEHAFEPFFTTKAPGEGTGLGLAVVYGVVSDAGGSVSIDSVQGQGTTVDVHLPLDEAPKTHVPRGGLPGNPARGCVMVVDDELENTVVLQRMLESLGFEVEAFTNPLRARDAFHSAPQSYDLVITDQVMPTLSGRELAEDLTGLRPSVPVLLCTGHQEVSQRMRGDVGFDGLVLDKPVLLGELAGAIQESMGPGALPSQR